MEKSVKDTLLERRCVRKYENRAISTDDLDFIHEAVRNTPTSYNGQQYSVIEIADAAIKNRMAEITGMKQLGDAPIVFMFVTDFNKIKIAAEAKNLEYVNFQDTVDGMIVGVVDASLAMMSAIVAAESRGLGTCPVGYARSVNPTAISELLKLPAGVFPVCALAVGIPADKPDLKPKEPTDLLFFKDTYGMDGMAEKLMEYDKKVVFYHQHRSSHNSDQDWIGKVLFYYREGLRGSMLDALKKQGYKMEK